MLQHIEQINLIAERCYIQLLVVNCRCFAVEDGERFHILSVCFRIVDISAVVLVQYMIKIILAKLCIKILVHIPGNDGDIAPYAVSPKSAGAKVLSQVAAEPPDLSVGLSEYVMPVVKIEHASSLTYIKYTVYIYECLHAFYIHSVL